MILLGNSFPLGLIRRRVTIEPASIEELRSRVAKEGFLSYWGHADSLEAAKALLGFDLAPATERPALSLGDELLPTLGGHTFSETWVLSPDYASGYRPKPGCAVPPEMITGWTVLHVVFTPEAEMSSAEPRQPRSSN